MVDIGKRVMLWSLLLYLCGTHRCVVIYTSERQVPPETGRKLRVLKKKGKARMLTTRTRPDIAACLGVPASLMARRLKQVKTHLVDLWMYLWTTMNHAMCTLPSPKASHSILKKEKTSVDVSCRGGPQTGSSSLKRQTYCDASFARGGGRSRSSIHVLMVDETINRASLILWQSMRQTLTA